ncbi:MAG: RHS repeat-associated core domain-containing protein [Desulfobacterales bacterium]|nr:RHS repeat-associated core domain-containing protein [Desulfobacterales bacterium]
MGNRLTKTESSSSTAYTYYPATNKLHEAVTGAETIAHMFDPNGNITGLGSKVLTYNQDNRLIRVEESGVTLGEYIYNGLGQRIIKTADGVMSVFLYDFDGNIIGESDQAGSISKEYLYKGSSRLAMVDVLAGKMYYYGNDQLGTPQIMTDSTNTVVWEADYKPFGEAEVNPNSTVVNNFRFPGQYYDAETGLYYNWHRFYDPKMGRYVSADPIGLEGGINLYTYVLNNPIRRIDPSGLKVYRCKRPFNPGKPGDKIPLYKKISKTYHEYNCIILPNGLEKCDSTSPGPNWPWYMEPGVVSDPKKDYYHRDACEFIDDDADQCVEYCLLRKWLKERPLYDIGPATDCQEYSSDTFRNCVQSCR